MDEPDIRVTVKVTLVSKDGFYTVSEFAPQMWESDRESALTVARADHAAERDFSTRYTTPRDRVTVDDSGEYIWSTNDNSMRMALVIGDPPAHIREAGRAIDALHAEPLATANLLRLIADEMERRANER